MAPPNEPRFSIKVKPEAEAVADLVRKHIAPQVVAISRGDDKSNSVLVLPDGLKAVSLKPLLDEYRGAPDRKEGTARAFDLDSFVSLVNYHKLNCSALFLLPERTAPKLTAVIDYHQGMQTPEATGQPHFCRHRVLYEFPLADEWKQWVGQNKATLTQEQFAAWIEDHILDLMDPSSADPSLVAFANKLSVPLATPSQLVALSRGLSVYAGFQMTKVVNLQTGEAQMQFQEEHKDAAGAPLTIPGAFVVALPVFRGGTRFQLAVRLRYRANTNTRTVSWYFELYQHERVFDTALEDASRIATDETSLPIYHGTPEVSV